MLGSMSRGWDNQETRHLVMALYGKQQWFSLAYPSVRSFNDRALFVEYHYHEAKDMLTKYIDEKLAGVDTMLRLHAHEGEYEEFSDMMLRIRAHVTAAVQSLHAMGDTCAHMLLYALALNREPNAPKPRDITAGSVLRLMEGKDGLDQLACLFRALVSGAGFQRIAALSNMAKHRSIVRPALNEDHTGNRAQRYELPFDDFVYERRRFSPVDVREFVQQQHDRMQHLLVEIGMELNAVLRARSTAQRSQSTSSA
jgi:hypothetical protein